MKKHLIIFLLAMAVLPSFAQKKEINTARDNIKKGVKLDEAEQSMNSLLMDSVNRGNEKIWVTLFEALKKKIELDNEKLYLEEKTDTAQLFSTTFHIFKTLEGLDSLDAHKDKRGVVTPKFRKKHADFLMQYAGNLLNGGIYYIRKGDYAAAYDYFDIYLQIQNQSLFSDSDPLPDKNLQQAAYGALVCGYQLGDDSKVFSYADLALQNDAKRVYVLQYLAETYRKENRQNEYRNTVNEGFREYPLNRYFFSHLQTVLTDESDYRHLLMESEKVLQLQPDNLDALLAQATALLHLERYKEAIAAADHCLKLEPDQKESLLNAGLAYYSLAKPLLTKSRPTKQDKQQLNSLLAKALPYMERYRDLVPDDVDVWGKPLYDIYLNLNMGDKFDELERSLDH